VTCIVPRSLEEAVFALHRDPGATVVAGGTDVMVEVNMGHRRPVSMVVVDQVGELRTWRHDPTPATLTIGAATTYAEIMEPPLRDLVPALAQAARTVGSPQIRSVATIGGNIATCSPAGDGLPVLSALDAVIHLASVDGVRSLSFGEFMVGPKLTALERGELITAVTLPVLTGWQGYAKVGVRNAMVIATASACLAVGRADHGSIDVRIALGSVGPVILRCPEAERFASDHVDPFGRVSDEDAQRFGDIAAAAARPIDDHRSTADYRRHAIRVLATRLLQRAFPGA